MSSIVGLVAGGTIQCSRFVVISDSNTVIAATGTSVPVFGISQEYSLKAPIPGATSEAANNADPIMVYTLGSLCMLQSSTAGWSAGDKLTATTAGVGVTATSNQQHGAIAISTLTGSGLGRVQVVLGKV